jgi:1-aminocyclopropane-1-carboxylate deaminase/D-cysteine desulfhydrase-like pyridoxal-dependent ACC family enzyme
MKTNNLSLMLANQTSLSNESINEIVRAVNSHEELVKGIRHIQDWLKDKYVIERDGNARAGFAHYVELCDEILAKAEGKGE